MPTTFDSAAEPDILYDYVPLKDRDEAERPREKLLKSGPGTLSDAELVALIFGSGTRVGGRSLSAVELGQTLLRAYGSLADLANRDARLVMRTKGVGPAKAAQLAACFEIGRRVEAATDGVRMQIKSPADAAAHYGPKLRDLNKEVFIVVLLNTAGVVIGDHTISEGGLAGSIVEPRAVFEKAILEHAASIICLHNHPSGNPEPSREDIAITKQLVEAGKLMGVPISDHLIIAGRGYTSFADRGLI